MRYRSTDEKQLVASILDRLLDDSPDQTHELPPRPAALINDVRASVCRDLRGLLNTRRRLVGASDEYPELEDSLVNYGLPDLQSYEVRDDRGHQSLCRMIQETIERFEPRLQDVRVTQKDLDRKTMGRQAEVRVLSFQIEAVLVVEPMQEPVVFTTMLDVSRSEFDVKVPR